MADTGLDVRTGGRRGLLVAAGATLAAGLPPRQGAGATLGTLVEATRDLPEFTFTDAEGRVRRVAEFAGKGLIVNLWATWCAPCVAEMPALDRAHAALAGDGILVLALSSDRGGLGQVTPFYAARGLRHLGIWLDPMGAAGRALGARGLPTTVIVDRAGRERGRLEGAAEWDAAPLLAAVRRLVGPPVPERA